MYLWFGMPHEAHVLKFWSPPDSALEPGGRALLEEAGHRGQVLGHFLLLSGSPP